MSSRSTRRLLVVDDEPALRHVWQRVLRDAGYDVTAVADGHAAVAVARDQGFDACVCDMMMPGVTGLDALRQLREAQPGLPVIIATAHPSVQTAVECLKEGAFDYIQKPCSIPELITLVDRAVEQRHLQEKVDLYEASRRLLGCLAVGELSSLTLTLAMDLIAADDGALLLATSEGGLALACTRTTAAVPTFDSSPLAEGMAARVASWRQPESIRSLSQDERFAGLDGRDLVRSAIVYPLILADRRVGALLLHRLARPGEFTRAEVQRLGVLAGQAALALENARIHEELGRRLAEVEQWGRQAVQTDKLAAVGMLAAGVAHEINNPLGFVIANLQALRDQLLGASPELGDLAGDALHGAQRIRVIARDLRAFARTDEQGVDAVDINETVTASLNIAHHQIKYRGTLVKDMAPGLPTINGNPGRLGQVFLNLVVNAAQALDPDRTTDNRVTVRTRRAEDTVEIQVSDTGCGIAPENLARLFTPFFTTKPRDVGTGLGLSICQDIVRQHRGSIRCDSRVGEGTTFTVSLPLETGRKRTITPVFMPITAESRRGRVLIVDDEPMLAHAYRRMLGREHDVTILSGGREALELLQRDAAFDAIFCDVMMPGMNGVAVYRAAVQHQPALSSRFVFMTGGAFTAESRAFLDSIDNPRLDKPIDVESFRRTIADRIATPIAP